MVIFNRIDNFNIEKVEHNKSMPTVPKVYRGFFPTPIFYVYLLSHKILLYLAY